MITVHFVPAGADGAPISLQCKPGRSLMQVAVDAQVEGLEAAWGGLMTCSTCHVYVREPHASRLPPAGEEELGMLAFTASPSKPNSRLSCQVELTQEMDGLTVDLPQRQV